MTEALHSFLRSRRSIRRFRAEIPQPEVIERILETTLYAPSAHNMQPWRFAILQQAASMERLALALTDKMRADMTIEGAPNSEINTRVERTVRRIREAPVIILLCRDITAICKEESEEHLMGIQSVALAGLQLLLAAHAEGLSGNWICWPLYAQSATRAALELPDTWEPQALVFLGYANEEPARKELKPLQELVRYL